MEVCIIKSTIRYKLAPREFNLSFDQVWFQEEQLLDVSNSMPFLSSGDWRRTLMTIRVYCSKCWVTGFSQNHFYSKRYWIHRVLPQNYMLLIMQHTNLHVSEHENFNWWLTPSYSVAIQMVLNFVQLPRLSIGFTKVAQCTCIYVLNWKEHFHL